ncbi:hypothetical protein [Microvirga massiliensis]|uniref:hypothetical protein n=1 Tax=Microvirga massiliensis TaxID=1033741 RepID=UPI00062B80BE|nr:hypothetical protein [Microvirga massiliensis]
MARIPIAFSSCLVGLLENANDNAPALKAESAWPAADDLARGIPTDEAMMVVRDPASGDWHIEDFEGEAILFTMPSVCNLDEVMRAAAVYAAAFKSGFDQARISLPISRC